MPEHWQDVILHRSSPRHLGRFGQVLELEDRQISPAARKLVAKDEGRLAFRNSDLEIRFDRVPAVRQQADVF